VFLRANFGHFWSSAQIDELSSKGPLSDLRGVLSSSFFTISEACHIIDVGEFCEFIESQTHAALRQHINYIYIYIYTYIFLRGRGPWSAGVRWSLRGLGLGLSAEFAVCVYAKGACLLGLRRT